LGLNEVACPFREVVVDIILELLKNTGRYLLVDCGIISAKDGLLVIMQ
jgi:hypothetical protein